MGGMSYWKRAVAAGQPFYYQNYFEPAVMIGCGKGFVVARPQVPAMVPFLWRQVDRFSCDAIAADAPLGTEDMFQQGSWRYLMLAVGYTWRLFGVSWSALAPLFALYREAGLPVPSPAAMSGSQSVQTPVFDRSSGSIVEESGPGEIVAEVG